MGTEIDALLAVAAMVVGILLLVGKGGFLLSDKNSDYRNQKYDMDKAQKGFGVTLIVVGIATGVSMLFTTVVSYVIYLVVVILAFAGGIIYMKKYCKK